MGNPGAVATHKAGQTCRFRTSLKRMREFENECGDLPYASSDRLMCAPDWNDSEPLSLSMDARWRLTAVTEAQGRLRSRDSFVRWISAGRSQSSEPDPLSQDEDSDEDDRDGEGVTFDREIFLESVRLKFSCICEGRKKGGGGGLSKMARDGVVDLISFIIDSIGQPMGVSSDDLFGENGLRDYESLMKKALESDSWKEKVFLSPRGWFKCHAIFDEDPISVLRAIIQDEFENLFLTSNWDGETFSHPTTGSFMRAHEDLIRKQRSAIGDWRGFGKDVSLLVTLYSDGTHLANKGTLNAHPMLMGIANLKFEEYQRALSYLGFLNVGVAECGSTKKRMKDIPTEKSALLAIQVRCIVDQIKRASFTGFEVEVNEKQYRFFPALFDMPVDNPEMTSLLGLLRGYCGECEWRVDGSRLSDSVGSFPAYERRTEYAARALSLGDERGYRNMECGLWGFNGSTPRDSVPESVKDYASFCRAGAWTPMTDLYRAVSTERLHQLDSGITLVLQQITVKTLREDREWPAAKIERMNNALENCVVRDSRWSGLRFPPRKKEVGAKLTGYFGGSSRVEASEHRTVLQVVVPVLFRFLGRNHPLTRLWCLYLKYYITRERRHAFPRLHSLESLQEAERLGLALYESLMRQSERDQRPKVHVLSHFTESVKREGFSEILSGDVHEGSHRVIKQFYRSSRTNKQKATIVRQVSQLIRRSLIVERQRKAADTPKDSPCCPARRRTTATLARELDMCCLMNPSLRRSETRFDLSLILEWVREQRDYFSRSASLEGGKSPWGPVFKEHFGSWTTAAAMLEEISRTLFDSQPVETILHQYPMAKVLIVPSATAPCVPWGQDRQTTRQRYLASLRCNRKFRVKRTKIEEDEQMRGVFDSDGATCWIDSVAVADSNDHDGEPVWYGRIALLFYLNVFDFASGRESRSQEWMPFLLLRGLQRNVNFQSERSRMVDGDDEPWITPVSYSIRANEETTGTWERFLPTLPDCVSGEGSSRSQRATWWFELISPDMVLRKIHLVAGNDDAEASLRDSCGESEHNASDSNAEFLINHYIWERSGLKDYLIGGESEFMPFEE